MEQKLSLDSFLVDALKEGDELAFKAIYRSYWKKLFYTALRKGASREEAEELVQNIFVSLWEKREVSSIEHLDRYLLTSLKYSIINLLRSKKIEENYVSNGARFLPQIDVGTEASLAFADLSVALEKGLACMPDKTRTIFKMNRLEYYTVKEISQSLNLPSRTIEYHLNRAIKSLRLHLKDFVLSFLFSLCFFN